MITQYQQITTSRQFEEFVRDAATVSRMDVNPTSYEKGFATKKKIGIYRFYCWKLVSASIVCIDESALTAQKKWALSSPSVYPMTIKTLADLDFVTRGEWIADSITHPVALRLGITVSNIIAYRLNCFMRKMFSPKYLTTPQLIIHRLHEYPDKTSVQFGALNYPSPIFSQE